MIQQTVTRAIEISVASAALVQLLADASRIPQWAPAFADEMEHIADQRWLARKGEQKFELDVVVSKECGTVDYLRELPSGRPGGAYMRAIDAPRMGSVVTMTVPIGAASSLTDTMTVVDEELSNLALLAGAPDRR